MRTRILAIAVSVAVSIASLAAGRPQPTARDQSRPDPAALQRDLARARERWASRKVDSYEFVLSIQDNQYVWSRRVSFRVHAGSSVVVMPPAGPLGTSERDTIDGLFDLIAEYLNKAPGTAFVDYDDEFGYPTNAFLGSVSFRVPAFRTFVHPDDVREPFVLAEHNNRCGVSAVERTDVRQCPTYAIAMWGDGTVTYDGRSGVRTLGRRQHQATQEAVGGLRSAIKTADFFSLQDNYSSINLGNGEIQRIDHAAEQWLTIRLDGRQKTVHDFYGTPDAVHVLEAAIEKAADSLRYTGRDR